MKTMKTVTFAVAILSPLLLFPVVHAQGYGSLDDDDAADLNRPQQHSNSFPKNQQISSLPKYDSAEEAAISQHQQQQPQNDAPGGRNLWWQNQNAFQRPPGHPGVEQLAPKQNQNQAPPAPPISQQAPNSGFNSLGSGQQYNNPQAPPDQSSYNNDNDPLPAPSNPYEPQTNDPRPQQGPGPQSNDPIPQQPEQPPYTSPSGQPSVSPPYTSPNEQQPVEPPPSFNNPHSGGWSAPSQQYQQQGQGSGQHSIAPGCELVNKADCHNNGVRRPPQNYQPPPVNSPAPFPQQSYQQQQPAPQQNIPQPNLSYRPPPPPKQSAHYRPNNPQAQSQPQQSQQLPYQNQNLPQPHSAHFRPNNPQQQQQQQQQSYQQNPRPSYNQNQPNNQYGQSSPQRQQPYTPPQSPRPRPQQQQQQHPQNPQDPSVPYPGCPAAMLCVQDEYCNMIGVVEENPIKLSAADRINRVALMQCSEPMTGIVGFCCRDPNYTDPWPDMQGGGGGMMKKNGNHHHHPDKGQFQSQSQGQQKSPAALRPPQGNHLASGGGSGAGANPYSAAQGPSGGNGNVNDISSSNNGWTRNQRNRVECDSSNNANNNQNQGAGGYSK